MNSSFDQKNKMTRFNAEYMNKCNDDVMKSAHDIISTNQFRKTWQHGEDVGRTTVNVRDKLSFPKCQNLALL